MILSPAIKPGRGTPMEPAATEPASSIPAWLVPVIAAASGFAGLLIRSLVDLVRTRDGSADAFRRDTLAQIRSLQDWNEKQQKEMEAIRLAQRTEQELRHQLKNQLNAEHLAHELLKHDYTAIKADLAKLTADYAAAMDAHRATVADYDKLKADHAIALEALRAATCQPPRPLV